METSFYWEGLVAGDATLAPYSPDRYHALWQIMFTRGDNEGIINGYLNSLEVLGITGGIKVLSGAALVDGLFYENDDSKSVEMAEPVADPRIDLIVIRKDWGTQTTRIAIIEGVENAAPTAPTATQTVGAIWEIPLAQALITTSGTITITDVREFPVGRVFPIAGLAHIETITSDGTLSQFDFQDIPDIYRHLKMEAQLRVETLGATFFDSFAALRINGDAGTNYNLQSIFAKDVVINATRNTGSTFLVFQVTTSLANNGRATQVDVLIPNYTKNVLHKNATITTSECPNNTTTDFRTAIRGHIWRDTNSIERLTIAIWGGISIGLPFISGSTVSLYGIS